MACFRHTITMTTDCSVPIFFDARQCLEHYEDQWAPATGPRRFMAAARQRHTLLDLHPVIPATQEDLYLVHDRDYVDGVLAGRRNNGYENTDPSVTDASLWAVGAMIQAAFHAPTTPYPVCVPVSDFRQAGFAEGGMFSTFNGVAVAAAKFLLHNPDAVIGILDFANKRALGTEDILSRHPRLAERVVFVSSSRDYAGDPQNEIEFGEWVESTTEALNQAGCHLIFYLAAVDARAPQKGDVKLSMTGRMLRDSRVFRKITAPIVWSFAGGAGVRPSEEDEVVRSNCLTLAQASQLCGNGYWHRIRAIGSAHTPGHRSAADRASR